MNVGRKLLGRPAILQGTGAKLGRVKDIVYGADQHEIVALKIEQDGLWPRTVLVPWQMVEIDGEAVKVETDDLSESESVGEANFASELVGVPVVTESGQQVGNVADVILTNSWDKIEGIELSEGIIPDFIDGRYTIPQEKVVTWGKDSIIVQDTLVQEQEGKT